VSRAADREATLPPQSTEAGIGDGTRSAIPCLTILYHPDLRRVGERVVLDALMRNQVVELSRVTPAFAHPGSDRQVPIADPYVSANKPLRLWFRAPGHLELAPVQGARVVVAGQPLDTRRILTTSELEPGLVFTLARRVVLLLHLIDASQPPGEALGLVGKSDAIEALRCAILQVADLDVPVLIRGESGAGKEHVARAIHQHSRRAGSQYIAVNMAAIHAETAVSELFGHAKGSFTGALHRHDGLFQKADQGTLFLDEIGDTPGAVQPMLLRVLDSGEIQPLGGASRRVDTRIIAATDADLEAAREQGTFRSALLNRLAAYVLWVPPLRARRDDIPRLILHFLRSELTRTGELHRLDPPSPHQPLWFPPPLMVRLVEHHWKGGNVRHLANIVRQLVVSSRGAEVLAPDQHLADLLAPEPG
jgi:two-component system nitrogen regulation response regulator GlnG